MANALNYEVKENPLPYLTVKEYQDAPTALSSNNLINGASQAVQDSELANVIGRASGWIDRECFQSLVARFRNEQSKVTLGRNGEITFVPDFFPIIAVTALSYGANPSLMQSVPDCSVLEINDRMVTLNAPFPYGSGMTTYPAFNARMPLLRYTYVHGFVNTTLAASASAGATSITVKDGAGIQIGQVIKIVNEDKSEWVTVGSSYAFGATNVPLAAPLVYAQAAGLAVHAMPDGIKQAAILATSAFIKVRGTGTKVLSTSTQAGGNISGSRGINTDLELAREMLTDFVKKF